ncbi:MAG: Glutathione S-transferase domain protein [Gammaproteobacteria bacterium]|nr:Glutathione S-transferase domain protein [Gammaproteobacteria bacterium]
MKLHWSPRSPFVRKVMIVAHETGLIDSIELVRSVAAMSNPNAELMVDNPLGKIPTLILDDGTSLFDSAVICEYLDGLHHGPSLFPKEGATRWQALRWQALGDGLMEVLILWRNERERMAAQQLAALLRAFDLKLQAALAVLDRETEEMEGAPFGIGHVTVGCALGYLEFRFADKEWRTQHRRLADWYGRLMERPSMCRTLPRLAE